MDLNQKLAARRAELAQEEERQRMEAASAKQVQEQAEREAIQAAVRVADEAKDAAEQLRLSRQTPATKVVDLDGGMTLLGQSVERVTKRQVVLLCCMAGLSLLSLTQDMTKALLWAVGALGYLGFILNGYAKDIKKSNQEP